jgi:hypothetical protein
MGPSVIRCGFFLNECKWHNCPPQIILRLVRSRERALLSYKRSTPPFWVLYLLTFLTFLTKELIKGT